MGQHEDFIGLVVSFDLTDIVWVEAWFPVHQGNQPAPMGHKWMVTLSFPAEGIDSVR